MSKNKKRGYSVLFGGSVLICECINQKRVLIYRYLDALCFNKRRALVLSFVFFFVHGGIHNSWGVQFNLMGQMGWV